MPKHLSSTKYRREQFLLRDVIDDLIVAAKDLSRDIKVRQWPGSCPTKNEIELIKAVDALEKQKQKKCNS